MRAMRGESSGWGKRDPPPEGRLAFMTLACFSVCKFHSPGRRDSNPDPLLRRIYPRIRLLECDAMTVKIAWAMQAVREVHDLRTKRRRDERLEYRKFV